MAARISSILLSRPWLPLLVATLLVALTIPLWSGAPSALGVGSLGGGGAAADLTIEVQPSASVAPRVAAVAIDATRLQLESDPGVASVTSARRAGVVLLSVDLRDDLPGARRDALQQVPAAIDPGPLKIEVGGAEAQLEAARDDLGGDLWRIALVALPFALLALSALAGWRWALALLVAVALGVPLTAVVVRIVDSALDVSVLALAVAAPVAIAAAAEIAWMLAHRAADLPDQAGWPDRLEAAISEGGRDALLWAGFAVLVGLLGAVTGYSQANALAVGVAAGVTGGAFSGWAVAVAALAGGRAAPVGSLEPAAALTTRLSGYSTGWRPPGSRIRRILSDSLKLAAMVIAVLAVSFAAYLLGDTLADGFDSDPPSGLGDAALACALAAGLAIVAARTGLSARIYREAASLGAGPGQAAAIAVEAELPGALATTVIIGLLGILLLVSDLGAAGEFGVIVAVVLLADALFMRILCAVCWARMR